MGLENVTQYVSDMKGWVGDEKVVCYVDDKNVGRVVRLARHQMVCVDIKAKRHYLQNSPILSPMRISLVVGGNRADMDVRDDIIGFII